MDHRINLIKPFTLTISDRDLDDLISRLDAVRWPAGAMADDWSRGVPLDYLKSLARYWQSGFDWRAQEAAINALPQFTTEIDGQTFHFVHVKSRQARRAADRPLPWLAGVVCRVPAACRAVDQRWVRRRDPDRFRASAFRRRSPRTAGILRGRPMPMPRSCRGSATPSMPPTAATSAPGSRGISPRSIPTASIGVHVASERNALTNAGVFLPLPDDLSDAEKAEVEAIKAAMRDSDGYCPPAGDASRRRWPTASPTRRSASSPGSPKSSRSGPTRRATCRRTRSTATSCSPM